MVLKTNRIERRKSRKSERALIGSFFFLQEFMRNKIIYISVFVLLVIRNFVEAKKIIERKNLEENIRKKRNLYNERGE